MKRVKKLIIGIIVLCLACGNMVSAKEEFPTLSKEYREAYIKQNKIKVIKFKKENKKIDNFLKKHQQDNLIPIKKSGKWGKESYSRTKEDTELFYIGGIKDNKPNGTGCIYKQLYEIEIGVSDNFTDPYYARIYEGNFKDGKIEGFGRKYLTPFEKLNEYTGVYEYFQEISDDTQTNIFSTGNPMVYEGYFKNGKYSGKGNRYEYVGLDLTQFGEDIGSLVYGTAFGEYILPESNVSVITNEELQSLTQEERQMAINEIYARHGRRFNDPEIQDYFDNKSWYVGSVDPEEFDDSVLNGMEKINIQSLTDGVVANDYDVDAKEEVKEQYTSSDIHISSGTFKKGKLNGKCKIYGYGVLRYEGNVKNEDADGKGTSYFSDGKQVQYEGQWKKNEYHGKGTEYDENGNVLYSGEWDMGDYAD